MGHSFLEVWGMTLSDFHHFPILICGADAPRTGGEFGVGAVSDRCRRGADAPRTGGFRCRSGVRTMPERRRRTAHGGSSVSERCQKGEFSLFKIEVEGDHAECGFVDALGVDFLCGVGEVVACFLQDVVESEAEFQFRNEFEEGQIDVAAQTCFQHEGEGARFDERAFACGEVIHWRDACHDVGAVVVEARRGNFEVGGNGKVA